ncbi:MAG: response regulator [Planctomycetota bacterium]
MSIRVTQSCPTCGRRVQFRAALLGYKVACPHCQSEFRAQADPQHRIDAAGKPVDPSARLMDRVERVLAESTGDSGDV